MPSLPPTNNWSSYFSKCHTAYSYVTYFSLTRLLGFYCDKIAKLSTLFSDLQKMEHLLIFLAVTSDFSARELCFLGRVVGFKSWSISILPSLWTLWTLTVWIQWICFTIFTLCVLNTLTKTRSACSNAVMHTSANQSHPQRNVLSWPFSKKTEVPVLCFYFIHIWPTIICPSALTWLYLFLNCRWLCFSICTETTHTKPFILWRTGFSSLHFNFHVVLHTRSKTICDKAPLSALHFPSSQQALFWSALEGEAGPGHGTEAPSLSVWGHIWLEAKLQNTCPALESNQSFYGFQFVW